MTDEKTPKAKPAPELITWYLAPVESDERRIVVEYLKQKRPADLEFLLEELDLAQLGPEDQIVVIGRGLGGEHKTDVRPVKKHEISGQTFDILNDYRDLSKEVLESAPLRIDATHKEPDGNGGYNTVPTYWAPAVGTTRRRQGGSLKNEAFCAALGRLCAPFCIRFRDGNSVQLPHHPRFLQLNLL
jgi:hypothetical protein